MSEKLDVNKLSKMAKLNVRDDEIVKIEERAKFLVADLDKLSSVNTQDVQPLIYANELTNILREDKVVKTITREELLANAPDRTDEYFRVPKTVE